MITLSRGLSPWQIENIKTDNNFWYLTCLCHEFILIQFCYLNKTLCTGFGRFSQRYFNCILLYVTVLPSCVVSISGGRRRAATGRLYISEGLGGLHNTCCDRSCQLVVEAILTSHVSGKSVLLLMKNCRKLLISNLYPLVI